MVQQIANCPMEFVCDRKWTELALTAREGVRRCGRCESAAILLMSGPSSGFQ
jgi:hypothetical protein